MTNYTGIDRLFITCILLLQQTLLCGQTDLSAGNNIIDFDVSPENEGVFWIDNELHYTDLGSLDQISISLAIDNPSQILCLQDSSALLIVSKSSNNLYHYDLNDNNLESIATLPDKITSVAGSNSSKTIALGSINGDIYLVDLSTRKLEMIADTNNGVVTGISFSPDDQIIACSFFNGTLATIEIEKQYFQIISNTPEGTSWFVKFGDHDRVLISGHDKDAIIWKKDQGKFVEAVRHKTFAWAIDGDLISQSSTLTVGTSSGKLQSWFKMGAYKDSYRTAIHKVRSFEKNGTTNFLLNLSGQGLILTSYKNMKLYGKESIGKDLSKL